MLDCVEPSLAAEGGGGQVRLEHCFHTSAVLPACGVLAGAAGYSVMVQQVEGGVIAAYNGRLSATFWGYLAVEWGRSCRGWWSGVACGELPENWHKTRVIAGCGLRTRGVYPTVVWEAAVGERALLFVVGS